MELVAAPLLRTATVPEFQSTKATARLSTTSPTPAAAAHANRAQLAHRDRSATPERMAKMVMLEALANLAKTVKPIQQLERSQSHALSAHPDLPVLAERWAPKDHQVPKDRRLRKPTTERKANLARLDQLVQPDDPDDPERADQQDHPARLSAHLDPLDPQDHPAPQVPPARKAQPEKMLDRAPVNPDHRATLEHPAPVVKKDLQAQLDQKDLRALMELAITALSLVCLLGIRIESNSSWVRSD